MRDILISINNSSESFEKTVGLIYTNIISNNEFYNKYDVYVFYGNNLPKQNKNLNISGTLGFYNRYFQNYEFDYLININDLWQDKENTLQKLIDNNVLSLRRANKILYDFNSFNNLLKNIPIEYLYPDFYQKYISFINNQFSNIHFVNMNLFDTYIKIFNTVTKNNLLYKIYALSNDGNIGIYNFNILKDEFYEKNKAHFFKSIKKSVTLSGNSAVFLCQIKQEIEKFDSCIIGYRNHKYKRPAREEAMNNILENYSNVIIEPKNNLYNSYFDKFCNLMTGEELANQVVLDVFTDFLTNRISKVKIK